MGLPEGMLHFMWTTCNEARVHVNEAVWLESHVASHIVSRARTRELTYQALMAYIEK